jgi:hypothetical protein
MSYVYLTERKELFTEAGLRLVLNSLVNAIVQCRTAGVCTDTITTIDGVGAASGWTMIAARDYLCEIGYLRQITRDGNRDVYSPTDKLLALMKEKP